LSKIERDFGAKERERLVEESQKEELRSLVVIDGDELRIPSEKMLLSDLVIEALMVL
jgi:hypothetical protein